jgi:hypothetical protein
LCPGTGFEVFGVQRFHIDDRLRLGFRCRAKHPGRALQELIAPLLDLVRLSGMQTCPAGNRWTSKSCASSIKVFSPLIAATATSPLKAGLWFRRGRLVMVISSLAAVMPPWRGKSTYPGCSVFPNHLSYPYNDHMLGRVLRKVGRALRRILRPKIDLYQ